MTQIARLFLLTSSAIAGVAPALVGQIVEPETAFFEKSIRPILADRCVACHNPVVVEAGLDLTTESGFRKGATTGALVNPQSPDSSRLLLAIGYEERVKMPPDSRLPPEEIEDLRRWVHAGALWSNSGPGYVPERAAEDITRSDGFTEEDKDWWAFRPLAEASPPPVDSAWPSNEIDAFVLSELGQQELKPAPPADKLSLLRRVTYNLTGLPPTPGEIRDFLGDTSEDAFSAVVDRLLASARYGERFGRHWLDVARYADSTGNDEDHRYPHGWRYRDYVIDAFNRDEPYDQFVRNQIAGDLLPSEDGSSVNARGIVATGLLSLGPKALAQQDKTKMLYDVYDEQLDVVAKAFMGLTVTCARCHDHKFDPIPTRDYYSMISIFASTRSFEDSTTHVAKLLARPLVPDDEYAVYRRARNRALFKRVDIDHVVDLQTARRNRRLAPKIASMMFASYRVYDGDEQIEVVAEDSDSDPRLLEKWVDYLTPREIPRPHLSAWHEASIVERAEVARQYQRAFRQSLESWNEKIAARWEEIQVLKRDLPDVDEPPPRRPEILEGEDRFFYDVHFHEHGPLVIEQTERAVEFSTASLAELNQLVDELATLRKAVPPTPAMASAVADGDRVDQKVFLRGDYRSPGEDAPLGFLSVLDEHASSMTSQGSGRLELAEWLTKDQVQLSARVMVNRVWQWHFGHGLVRTPNNFGKMGERPSHPELLDFLARRFIESGWSVKSLNRLILLSSTYHMASDVGVEAARLDPENRWLSHFSRRRLDVEEIRDGLLSIDGSLDLEMGGTLDPGTGTDLENSNARLSIDPAVVTRRMVYLPLRRANLPTLLGLFDFGDAVNSVGQRARTNVAPQALFMMNSEFIAARAKKLTTRLFASPGGEDSQRVERLYLRILNRAPTDGEIDDALVYLSRYEAKFLRPGVRRDGWESLCRALIASNEFIYLD